MVTDLDKLSRAIANATPEKIAERELQQKAEQIQDALRRNGVYDDKTLGVRISTNIPVR